MFLLSSPMNFGRLVAVNGTHLRWDSCKFFFHGNRYFFLFVLKETAVKWCIAFVYLCNIVHVYFFYLCYCLWITEPCPWISDSLISIYSKWKILNLPRWYCFWFVSCCFLLFPSPPCRSECFIWLTKRPHSRENGMTSLIETIFINYMWIALSIILFIHPPN